MKSPAWLANAGHFLAGYGAMVTAGVVAHAWMIRVYVWLALIVLVAVKEYVIDLRFESDEDVESSTVDALGYSFGMGAGWALLGLAAHFGWIT